jgi:chitinase
MNEIDMKAKKGSTRYKISLMRLVEKYGFEGLRPI